jgi:hypothetical protein
MKCGGRGRVTTRRRAACKSKALHKLGFPNTTAPKSADVGGFPTWGPGGLVCPGANFDYSRIYGTTPEMMPYDLSQNSYVAYYSYMLWYNRATGQWVWGPHGDWTYHYYAADYFDPWHEIGRTPYFTYVNGQAYYWDGSWQFNAPPGYWYAIYQYLYWYPQNGVQAFGKSTWATLGPLNSTAICWQGYASDTTIGS